MTTGQTILTMAAFMFLSTILLNFYQTMNLSGDQISSGQDGILSTTIATSYMEIAQGLAFDVVTDTSDIALYNVSALTSPGSLGREGSFEDSLQNFDDVDDFNNYEIVKTAGNTGRRYKTTFKVNYVNISDANSISSVRTFVKRLDLKTWRIAPPLTRSTPIDTLKLSMVSGYFHFD